MRTFDGPVKAVVRTRHRHSKHVLVTLDGAVSDGDAIVVSTVVPGARDAEAPWTWLWHSRGRSASPRRAASPDLIDQTKDTYYSSSPIADAAPRPNTQPSNGGWV